MPRHAALIEQGVQLHRSRRFREAEYMYQSVLRENPRHPDAVNLMGVLAIEAGQNTAALGYLHEAVKLAPKQAIYRNNLGNALIIAGQYEDALPHLRRAVTLSPSYAEAWCNTGKAWRMIGDMEAAEKYFRKTLLLSPGFLRAQAGLAEIESEMGRFDQAAAAFERILDLDPRNVDALCGITQTRRFAQKDPIILMFEQILRDCSLRDDQRAPLHHAFAKICNDIGEYEEAFKHFARGKELKKLKFHMELHRETYAAARAAFTPEFFAARNQYGSRDGRPVFIVGMPRSGTTLTEQILASHPMVTGLGELPDMRKIMRALDYGSASPAIFASNVEKLDRVAARELADTYLKAYSRAPSGQVRLIDKTPHNYENLGLIALLFPNARIIHCRRNPLDNCVACYMQNFSESHGYNGDLTVLGAYYREYQALMEHWRRVLPIPMIDIDYEEMVADQEGVTRRLIYFAGIEWSDECLRFFDLERQVRTPSRWQVRQPIYSSSVGRWKRYEKFLDPLKAALADIPRPASS
jgi:tetratricopeptide (TPR) repeat protein